MKSLLSILVLIAASQSAMADLNVSSPRSASLAGGLSASEVSIINSSSYSEESKVMISFNNRTGFEIDSVSLNELKKIGSSVRDLEQLMTSDKVDASISIGSGLLDQRRISLIVKKK